MFLSVAWRFCPSSEPTALVGHIDSVAARKGVEAVVAALADGTEVPAETAPVGLAVLFPYLDEPAPSVDGGRGPDPGTRQEPGRRAGGRGRRDHRPQGRRRVGSGGGPAGSGPPPPRRRRAQESRRGGYGAATRTVGTGRAGSSRHRRDASRPRPGRGRRAAAARRRHPTRHRPRRRSAGARTGRKESSGRAVRRRGWARRTARARRTRKASSCRGTARRLPTSVATTTG